MDEYETDRYVYRGANPDNYIQFNDELWRIIAVEGDGKLRIMRNSRLSSIAWDETDSNNWARPATLNTYLNEDFYDTFTDQAKAFVVDGRFYTGSVDFFMSMQETIDSEKTSSWTGKIGLRTVSDFFKASVNSECDPAVNGWLSTPLGSDQQNYKCSLDNYFFQSGRVQYSITPYASYTNRVFYMNGYGAMNTPLLVSSPQTIYPVLHLTPQLRIESGTGTSVDPYVVRSMGESDVSVSINSALALEVSVDELALGPVVNGGTEKGDLVVSVSTNDISGYKLVMSIIEDSANTSLNYMNTDEDFFIPSVSSAGELAVNTWGYTVGEAETASSFRVIPSYTLPDTLKTKSGLSLNDETPVTFGVRVNMDIPAGSYRNTVSFTVVGNL